MSHGYICCFSYESPNDKGKYIVMMTEKSPDTILKEANAHKPWHQHQTKINLEFAKIVPEANEKMKYIRTTLAYCKIGDGEIYEVAREAVYSPFALISGKWVNKDGYEVDEESKQPIKRKRATKENDLQLLGPHGTPIRHVIKQDIWEGITCSNDCILCNGVAE